jgi:hypothetical protein
MDVFDFLKSINNTKQHLYEKDPDVDKIYVPYVINKAFSYFLDTALHSNFINSMPHLSKRMQYDYYFYTVKKANRFKKWPKLENVEDVEVIKTFYDCSEKKAREYLQILSKDQIESLRQQLNTGGNIK